MAGVVPDDVSLALASGGPPRRATRVREAESLLYAKGVFYAREMATRPQTLYGIADSPVGLAAWLWDHGDADAQPTASFTAAMQKPTQGQPQDEFTRDDVLDNTTLFWLTNTAISSARLYWENKFPFFGVKGVKIPVAVSAFPGEFYQAPESWAKRAFPKLVHYNKLTKGGHFAAWEQPQLFASELRAGFRSLRG